jgi:hypothetical protein
MPGPTDYTIFADESATAERFLAYGGIFLPSRAVEDAESALGQFAANCGFGAREFSWKKCSRGEVDRYVAFAEQLWKLRADMPPIDFRALVVDTTRYPLRDPDFDCATDEDGFYRFYHFFITKSLARIARDASSVSVVVASTTDQYPYRTEILHRTVTGGLRKELGEKFTVSGLGRAAPKGARLHQLADVLVGAVTFRWNADKRSLTKSSICEAVERLVGRRLDDDFTPGIRPFNVWVFTRSGQKRWVRGSSGRV